MLSENQLTEELSSKTRTVIGVLCISVFLTVLILSYLANNDTALVITIVVGVPLALVGLSLVFGKASKGKGIFSSLTLYLLAVFIGTASLVALYFNQPKSGLGLVMAFGCFVLAKKRRRGQ